MVKQYAMSLIGPLLTQHQQRLGETCIFTLPTIVIFQSRLVAHNERNSAIPVILIHVND